MLKKRLMIVLGLVIASAWCLRHADRLLRQLPLPPCSHKLQLPTPWRWLDEI